MSRRPDIDADAPTAALLRAVAEARAAQAAPQEAARGKDAGQTAPSVEAIRAHLTLLEQLRDMGMEIVQALDKHRAPPGMPPGRLSPCRS